MGGWGTKACSPRRESALTLSTFGTDPWQARVLTIQRLPALHSPLSPLPLFFLALQSLTCPKMQAPNYRYGYTPLQEPQGLAIYQRPVRPPPPVPTSPFPTKVGMEIGGLLNARNAAAADAQLRRQLQQSMQMDGGVAYGLSHGQGPPMLHHQQHQMQQAGSLGYPPMAQPQHSAQLYSNNFIPRHDGQHGLADDNFGAIRPKNEGALKTFACSTCSKGFARRSDLARHGKKTCTSNTEFF